MLDKLSWSEVDSDSYVGWLVGVGVKVIDTDETKKDYCYMVITKESEDQIFGSWSYTEEGAIIDYRNRIESPFSYPITPSWRKSAEIRRIKKIF